MNKKYIDFVPTRSAKKPTVIHKGPKEVPVANVAHKKAKVSTTTSRPQPTSTMLGVVEDIPSAKPRTTSIKPVNSSASSAKLAKSKKLTGVALSHATLHLKPKEDKKTYQTPKSPFINQDKVEKRPLSKNVYRKAPVVTKEDKKAPVTIIAKPEKDTKIGLIITIILTIILGAAAGTVAFLLLPK